MNFKITIPSAHSSVRLEATVEAGSWFEAMQVLLQELGRDPGILNGAKIDLQRDGRIKVTDPKSGHVYELESVSKKRPAKKVEKSAEAEVTSRATIPGRKLARPKDTQRLKKSPDRSDTEITKTAPKSEDAQSPKPSAKKKTASRTAKIQKERPSDTVREQPSIIVNIPQKTEEPPVEPLPILVIDHSALAEQAPVTEENLKVPSATAEAPSTEEPAPAPSKTDQAKTQPFARMDHPTVLNEPTVNEAEEKLIIEASEVPTHTDARFDDLKTGRNLEIVAGSMLRAMRSRVEADAGVVLVPDGKHRYVIIAAAFGLPKSFKARRFKYGDGVGGFSCEFDSALHINDLAARPDLLGELEEAFDRVSSVMACPVRTKGRTYGAVELLRIEGAPFEEDEYFMLQDLCEAQAKNIGKKKK